ncbi:hypothetical protein D3C84_644840 [compost metagenome]
MALGNELWEKRDVKDADFRVEHIPHHAFQEPVGRWFCVGFEGRQRAARAQQHVQAQPRQVSGAAVFQDVEGQFRDRNQRAQAKSDRSAPQEAAGIDAQCRAEGLLSAFHRCGSQDQCGIEAGRQCQQGGREGKREKIVGDGHGRALPKEDARTLSRGDLSVMRDVGQLSGVHANKSGVAHRREHIPGVDLADDPSLAPDITFDFRPQGQRDTHRRRFDELDAEVARDAIDARKAGGVAVFRPVVIGHGGPVGMAIHQHRDQTAVDQIRPAAIPGVGHVLGDDMLAVFMPVALDVQPMRVAAATAITNAFRRRGVLQGNVGCGHAWVILKSVG